MTNDKIIAFMKDYSSVLDSDRLPEDERLQLTLETIAIMLGTIALRLPEPTSYAKNRGTR